MIEILMTYITIFFKTRVSYDACDTGRQNFTAMSQLGQRLDEAAGDLRKLIAKIPATMIN